MIRRVVTVILSFALLLASVSCLAADAYASGNDVEHTIAVLVYDFTDDEVVSFRKYLQDYLGEIFNVRFVYSASISSGEEALAFIQDAADYGAEGIMSFNTYDLEAEVALSAENHMYFMLASGTVSDKAFASVEDNPYFVGVIGPGSFIEYKAGSDMAKFFLEKNFTDEYFVLSGGGGLGNEMHRLRTEGILDTLQNAYGVHFDISSHDAAVSLEPLHLTAGDLTVHISPGYFRFDEYLEMAKEEYASHPCQVVMSVLPAVKLSDTLRGAHVGVVDCYSESNLRLFTEGQLDYVCGKYSSIIGPSFAAMYNAITGNAELMRPYKKAFHITQGFWSSRDKEDYTDKYALANSIEMNAYNYADLQTVMLPYNPEATFDDLKELAEHYTYRDALERRT